MAPDTRMLTCALLCLFLGAGAARASGGGVIVKLSESKMDREYRADIGLSFRVPLNKLSGRYERAELSPLSPLKSVEVIGPSSRIEPKSRLQVGKQPQL